MPRYFFGYEGEAPETLGDELPDDGAAREVAAKVSEELGRNLAVRPRISIFNERGELVEPRGGLTIELDIESRPTHH